MPRYVGYSPWQDAAEYGRGLGQTIAQILLTVPQMRREEQYRQRADDRAERSLGSLMDWREAQTSRIPGELAWRDVQRKIAEEQNLQRKMRLNIDLGELEELKGVDYEFDEQGNLIEVPSQSKTSKAKGNAKDPGLGQRFMDIVNPFQDAGGSAQQPPSLPSQFSGVAPGQLVPSQQQELDRMKGVAEQMLKPQANTDIMIPGIPSRPKVSASHPPTAENNVLVRIPGTGQMGWVTEAEAGDYEVIKVVPKGFSTNR